MFKEENRQGVHILFFLFTFLFKYLSRFQVLVLLLILLFITVTIVPRFRVKDYLYRQFEKKYSRGAISYFLTLFVLALIFPLHIVAVSWVILALGDGMATLVGKNFKAQELPWNKNKSYYGSMAFIFFAAIGSLILLKWLVPGLSIGQAFSIGLKTSIVAAIVESLPWQLDDNITVPLASAVVIYFLI